MKNLDQSRSILPRHIIVSVAQLVTFEKDLINQCRSQIPSHVTTMLRGVRMLSRYG